MDKGIRLNINEHKLYFKDTSCGGLETCKALCCRKFDINIAFDEEKLGIYKTEAFCALDRKPCKHPKKPCPHRAFRLKKKKDRSCLYLNKENRCEIYSMRPIVCRNFICDKGFMLEPVCSPRQDDTDDVEICSFEGGLPMNNKFILNPYLELKKLIKVKNTTTLRFKNLTSCKEKTVKLTGIDYFDSKKDFINFLGLFDGKTSLSKVRKNLPVSLSKTEFQNITLYLIDEEILVGVF